MTVSNVLCAVRLIGSVAFVPLSVAGLPLWVLGLFLALTATDWIDGKLAVWLDQRSTLGARFDSAADAAMYAGLLFAGVWLKGPMLLGQWLWIAPAVVSYAVSCLAALVKFRRLPSYHTRSAKTSWLLMVAAVAAVFLDGSIWPLRIAMLGVLVANVESMLITAMLRRWRADVLSIFAARRLRSSETGGE